MLYTGVYRRADTPVNAWQCSTTRAESLPTCGPHVLACHIPRYARHSAFCDEGNLSLTEFGLGASPSANLSWLVKSDLANLTLAISFSVGIVLWFTVVVFSWRQEVERGLEQVNVSASELSVEGIWCEI